MKETIKRKDLIREFSRGNFKHVNDTAPLIGYLSFQYSEAVVKLAETVELIEAKLGDTMSDPPEAVLRWIASKLKES